VAAADDGTQDQKEAGMQHKMVFQNYFLLISAAVLMAACAPSPQAIQTAMALTQAAWTPTTIPPPILTLTINEMECSFDGPLTIPYGEFMIKLVLIEQRPTDSGYALARLVDGKTVEDLKAWSSGNQPPWFILIDGVHENAGGNHTYSYDLRKIPSYNGDPLVLMCARISDTGNMLKLGVFGPIEVKK
jgi:hypothetical protein